MNPSNKPSEMKPYEPKNIVICCDGTGNQFGVENSNVIKLFSVLESKSNKQVLYYHPGVGTKSSLEPPGFFGSLYQAFKNWHAFAFGYGFLSNVANAYHFLMDTYRPGDRLFLVGFSRGAFTIRALCSLVHEFGVLDRGCHSLVTYMVHLLFSRKKTDEGLADHFKKTFGRPCDIHFVGIWETVNSVGWIYDRLVLPFEEENSSIRIGRQALSIDENRCLFTPNLWGAPEPGQDIRQVWFAGAHSDVGGGYRSAGLANITLAWMTREIEAAGVLMDPEAKRQVLQENVPDPKGMRHFPLKGMWWIPEFLPLALKPGSPSDIKNKWELHRGKPRPIPEHSLLHESVRERLEAPGVNYAPVNLPKHFEFVP